VALVAPVRTAQIGRIARGVVEIPHPPQRTDVAAQDPGDVVMIFQSQVDAYMALRQRARDGVAPEQIIDPRIRAISGALLASRLRALRPGAAEGDVFSTPVSALIRDRLHRAFNPAEVGVLLAGSYSMEAAASKSVHVNWGCAAGVLVMPPAKVLAALPPVPGVLGYRFAGLDLVLWDEEASIVIDVIRDALPEPTFRELVDDGSLTP
jgi:hypothetical protein